MAVSNALDPIELPANVSLLQERGLSRYRPLSNIIQPYHSRPRIVHRPRFAFHGLIASVIETQLRSEGAGISPAINQAL